MNASINKMKIIEPSDFRYKNFERIIISPLSANHKGALDCIIDSTIKAFSRKQAEFELKIKDVLTSSLIKPAIKYPITKGKIKHRGLRLSIQKTMDPLVNMYIISQRGVVIAKIID